MWLGGLGFEAGSDQDFNLYLLLSWVATVHTGGRARGGYGVVIHSGWGKGRKQGKGRREGRDYGNAGYKGRLDEKKKEKKILGLVDTQQHDNMKLTIARRVSPNEWAHGLSKQS